MFETTKEPREKSDGVNISEIVSVKNELSVIKEEVCSPKEENSSSNRHTNVKTEVLDDTPCSEDEGAFGPGGSLISAVCAKQELEIGPTELQPPDFHFTPRSCKPDPDYHNPLLITEDSPQGQELLVLKGERLQKHGQLEHYSPMSSPQGAFASMPQRDTPRVKIVQPVHAEASVTPDDADRASRDSSFLQQLVNAENERRSLLFLQRDVTPPIQGAFQLPEEVNVEENARVPLFLWTPQCIQLLLALYEEHNAEFGEGAKRHNKIWETIALTMRHNGYNVSGAQCQSKVNGLKRTYKKILDHNKVSGNDRKTWPYFERMNQILGMNGWAQSKAVASEAGPTSPADSAADSTTPKRKKVNTDFEDYRAERKEAKMEKARKREEKQTEKSNKFDKLMAQREAHHKEKMAIFKTLMDIISKK